MMTHEEFIKQREELMNKVNNIDEQILSVDHTLMLLEQQKIDTNNSISALFQEYLPQVLSKFPIKGIPYYNKRNKNHNPIKEPKVYIDVYIINPLIGFDGENYRHIPTAYKLPEFLPKDDPNLIIEVADKLYALLKDTEAANEILTEEGWQSIRTKCREVRNSFSA